jgi:signal transduction histidine kinase/ActR/RegA family two-component response regulator
MMIEKIQNKFVLNRSQTVVVNKKGVIVNSSNNLFSLKLKSKIQDFHPFFEVGFIEIFKKPFVEQTFQCVHIAIESKIEIYDVYVNSGTDELPPFLVFYDFTERYTSFQTIAQEKNESALKFRAEELRGQKLKIEKELKDKFLANVSHDLRTPIASMIGFLEIFQQTQLSREQHDILKTVFDTAQHLNGLVEDLIDLARIEAGQFILKSKTFDFYDFVEQIEKTYFEKTARKNIDFVLEYDDKIPKFLISDRTRLFQLVTNVMDNAVKFTDRGKITVTLKQNYRRADNVGIQMVVSDTGIGISSKNNDVAFQSFTKLHGEDFGGLGLGLSIVKEIVTKMSGTVKIKSELRIGTAIEINLPLKINMEVSAKAKKITPKAFLATDFTKKFKILVVDDNETNQLLILKMLSDHGGFFIDITDSASQGLQVLDHENYDLLLIDVNMPNKNGIEMVRQIKAHENQKIAKLPIIMLSANPTTEEKRLTKELGIKDYIARPHTRETLFMSIYKTLKVKKDFL